MAAHQGLLQAQDDRYVRQLALSLVDRAQARTPREKTIALRDYLRAHVTWHAAPCSRRPLLRATAAETLRSLRGYCGEDTRAFICMAAAVGVSAQRLNLWGSRKHVVAEATLAPGEVVIVDCQSPPQVADLEPLEQVILNPPYGSYSTVNVRRLHLERFVSHLRLEPSFATYWMENPHAIKATLWLMLAAAVAALSQAWALAHWWLHRRGWMHGSQFTIHRVAPLLTSGNGVPHRSPASLAAANGSAQD